LPVCEVTCDPLLQNCAAGQGCYAAFENFVCAVPGHDDGSGGDGDECATVQGCQPGLLCRNGTDGCNEGSGCCTPVCALSNGGSECMNPAEECVAALDAPPPGLADVGYCGVPA
ncbi:MAG: ribulose phosphate epimerase, partial [Myxococcota bacterium]